MAKEHKLGQMGQILHVNGIMGLQMGKEFLHMLMGISMKVNSKTIELMGMEFTDILAVTDMKVIS